MSYANFVAEDIRLIILRALATEVDYTLNENLLAAELDLFGHRKGRDYIRNELRWLESEAGAITLREAGSVMIATLTQRGRDHVERRVALAGVKRPSPPEA